MDVLFERQLRSENRARRPSPDFGDGRRSDRIYDGDFSISVWLAVWIQQNHGVARSRFERRRHRADFDRCDDAESESVRRRTTMAAKRFAEIPGRRERGATLFTFAVALVMLIGIAGLAIDL